MRLREICCDSCPYDPTCEDENEFLRDIGLADDERGEEDDERQSTTACCPRQTIPATPGYGDSPGPGVGPVPEHPGHH